MAKLKLQFASLLTLGILSGFVFSIVLAVAYYGSFISAPALIIFTVLINFIIWLVSPWFSDLINKWFYKTKFYTHEELKSESWMKIVEKICDKYDIKVPKIGIIDDLNPTAFTYGSAAYNARIVLTKGIFKFLNEKEVEAVIAHELGHIINRDFIIMTIASTLLQLLYQFYVIFARSRMMTSNYVGKKGEEKKGDPFIFLGLVSFVFYFVGTYLLMFLSRTREYYADEFSAKETRDPNSLSSALIKIAYGIATVPDTASMSGLLESTRAQGIFDVKTSKEIGLIHSNVKDDKSKLEKSLLFDLVNPWAWLRELKSTHPLVGKRIDALCKLTNNPAYDFDNIKNISYSKKRMWGGFGKDILITYLPSLTFLIFLLLIPIGFVNRTYLFVNIFILFVVLIFEYRTKLFYKYPLHGGFEKKHIIDCMSDIYASPVRGTPIALEGEAIGRAQAGYMFSEDMMFQDKTGFIYLNYESGIPLLGNLFFAWKKVEKLLGLHADVNGWFLRSNTHHLELYNFSVDGQEIQSYNRMWTMIGYGFSALFLTGAFGFLLFL
ncbi:M48 family metalloprotease [Candidatus Woesearchaeota archaeon]|nr:M48 family metalloprotease [Candidatus Woesearchaeota archaeon]